MNKHFRAFISLVLATFLLIAIPSFSGSQDRISPSDRPSPPTTQTPPGSPVSSPEPSPLQTVPTVKETGSIPVILGDQTLFVLETGFESISAETRAEEIRRKLETLAKDVLIPIDAIQIGEQNNTIVLFAGETVLVRVTEADARAVNSNPQQLANDYLKTVKGAIAAYRENLGTKDHSATVGLWGMFQQTFQFLTSFTGQGSRLSYSRAILYTVLATLLLIACLLVLQGIFAAILKRIKTKKSNQTAFKIGNFELLSADQVTDILVGFTQKVRLLFALGILCLYLVIVFSFFPLTQRIGAAFSSHLSTALINGWNAFVAYLPKLINIVLILIITSYLLNFIKPIFTRLGEGKITLPGFYPDWALPTYRLLELLIGALAAVLIFPYLPGFGSDAFQGVSIFLGILVSLGSTAAITNAVAGIILIYTRAFQIGDRVKIVDTIGNVEEKLLLVTRIRTFDNVIVTIPNAVLLSNNVNNYSASRRDTNVPVILSTTVTLGYDVPWRKIYDTLTAAALATPHVLEDPAPFVFQTSLGDFSVSYELKVYTDRPTVMEEIYSELHKNMQDKCNEADIEILSPTYSAIRDGNQSTIPNNYLPNDYTAPGFQLHPLGNLFQIDLQLGNKAGNKAKNPKNPS